jgi:hypothetical protein
MKNIVISFALLMAHFGQSQIQGTVKDLKGKHSPTSIFLLKIPTKVPPQMKMVSMS